MIFKHCASFSLTLGSWRPLITKKINPSPAMQIHEATIINGKVNALNFSSSCSSWLSALLDAGVVKLCSDLLPPPPTKFWQMASLSDSDLGKNKGTTKEAESNPVNIKMFENHPNCLTFSRQKLTFEVQVAY